METTRLTVTTEEAGQRADSLLAQRLEGLTRSAAASSVVTVSRVVSMLFVLLVVFIV